MASTRKSGVAEVFKAVLKGDATPLGSLEALGTPYRANKLIGTGSRAVNNALSLLSKTYPRVVLVHEEWLICCKVEKSDWCSQKWIKRLAIITRLRRIPKPSYAVTGTAEVAVEFDEVDAETGCLFEEIFSFAADRDADAFMREVEEGRETALRERKARAESAAARAAASAPPPAQQPISAPPPPPPPPPPPAAAAVDFFGDLSSPAQAAAPPAPPPAPKAADPLADLFSLDTPALSRGPLSGFGEAPLDLLRPAAASPLDSLAPTMAAALPAAPAPAPPPPPPLPPPLPLPSAAQKADPFASLLDL